MIQGTILLTALICSSVGLAQDDETTPAEETTEEAAEETTEPTPAPVRTEPTPQPPPPPPPPPQQEFSEESLNTVVVVVNAANETSIELGKKLNRYYLKYILRWPKLDLDVTPVDYATHTPLRERFVSEAIGYTQDEMERYWIERQYQSSIIPPVQVQNEVEMLQYIKANPGAIGYVSAAILEIDGAKDGVRVIGEIPPDGAK